MPPYGGALLEDYEHAPAESDRWVRDQRPSFFEHAPSIYRLTRMPSEHLFMRAPGELEILFGELRAEWEDAFLFQSVTTAAVLNPAYQRIVGLGPAALPLILKALSEDGSSAWFWALRAIAGEDVAAGSETVSDAVEAWLSWGQRHGLV